MNRIQKRGVKPKLDALTKEQKEQVIRWLVVEEKSYELVRSLIQEQFSVSVSECTLSKFYHRECLPLVVGSKPATAPLGEILLDVAFQSEKPIRLKVLSGLDNGLRVQVMADKQMEAAQ